MTSEPIVWALLGERTGDNNQVLALAEALGHPFVSKNLRYNLLRALSEQLGPTIMSIKRSRRGELVPPWPDLVIAIGRRSVPVARWIRKQSGGHTKLVLIGFPRQDPRLFDLVITSYQYPVPAGDNVVVLPITMSRFSKPPEPGAAERDWLDGLARPLRLLAIGGHSKYWELPPSRVADAIRRLQSRPGGLIVATSRRTPPEVIEAIQSAIAAPTRLLDGKQPRFAVVMGQADEVFVTGDSVSMISESITLGKPTGLVPITMSDIGVRKLDDLGSLGSTNRRSRRRDLRKFWQILDEMKLIGSIDQPSVGADFNSLPLAVSAVRALLDGPAPRPTRAGMTG
ncbi:MAG: ELM1/GtrOC1 family putative glycosyltransferase [Sphingomicrobium sp.]